MAKPSRSHDALQQLLDERKRYEQWIATLESRRESTPEHVFKRVHADYDQRLTGVREQLTERTGEIRSAISALKDRLKQASEQEAERVDEMHEAELRSAVGELTPEQWELRKREVEVDITRFADDKKKISEELNQLLLVMEQVADHGTDAEPASPPAPASSAPSAPSAPSASPVPTATPVPSAAPEPSASVQSAMPLPAAAPPPATAAPADAARVRSKTPAKSRVAMHGESAAPTESEKPPVPIESLAPAKHTKSSGTARPADPRHENDKTLKCGECGAMNYPTEWYCESCGGELSAL